MLCICKYTHTYIHIFSCLYTCLPINRHTDIFTQTHTHICILKYIYTCMHTTRARAHTQR